jgi:hypothetical protein
LGQQIANFAMSIAEELAAFHFSLQCAATKEEAEELIEAFKYGRLAGELGIDMSKRVIQIAYSYYAKRLPAIGGA